MAREFQLVLWGATGFTGKLTAQYLAAHAPKNFRWALGGRNEAKLDEVRRAIGVDVPLVVADAASPALLDELVKRTDVVATTVGPFRKYGEPLVAACARNGTAYADLTGEPHFIRQMIDAHHEEATKTGARIVHCAGFDSIPSDLGVLVLQHCAMEKHGRPVDEVKLVTRELKGGVSGGTFASALLLAEDVTKDPALRRSLANPYLLDPAYEGRGPEQREQRGFRYDEDARCWTAPWVMAGVNTRIVRRSNSLLGYRYGRGFKYSETMGLGDGPKGFVRAAGFTAGLGAFFASAATKPGRSLLRRVLPAPGEGPSENARANGRFHLELYGRTTDGAVRVKGDVRGVNDPGYGETAKMLAETAMALAESKGPGGSWTPASGPGLGMALVQRLLAAGMTFHAE